MKALKRILSAVLVSILAFSCVPFGAVAEEDYGSVLSGVLEEYYDFSDNYMEYSFFSEGELPEFSYLYNYLRTRYRGFFGEYCTTTEGDGIKIYTYKIPADVLEEKVFENFEKTDSAVSLLRSSKEYVTEGDESYYTFDGVDMILESSERHMIKYAGYREREDGLFETWSYIADDVWMTNYGSGEEYEYEYYTPDEDDVEGVDFLFLPVSVYDFSNETHYGMGFSYVPAKIFYTVKSVVRFDDDGVRFVSFEKTEVADVPDDLTGQNVTDKNEMQNSTMYTTKESFGAGAEIYEGNSSIGITSSRVQDLLYGIEKNCTVRMFTAVLDGEMVSPLSPVKVAFEIPGNYDTDVRLYRIYTTEDGLQYELMESVVDADARTVSAEIDDFGCAYAICGEYKGMYGDTDHNGKVNLADVARIMKYLAKWSDVEIDLEAADVTHDDRVNLADAAKLLKHIAKWYVNPIAPEPSSN